MLSYLRGIILWFENVLGMKFSRPLIIWGRFLLFACLASLSRSSAAATISVPAGGSLQTAINNANPGDTILLQAGATYFTNSGFHLPNKGTSTQYITIQSSRFAELPAAGYRIKPSQSNLLPKLAATADGAAALYADSGAHHYQLIGLEVALSTGVWSYRLLEFGSGSETLASQWPHHITVDRCYIWAHMPGVSPGTKRGIQLNGANIDVLNSYISGIANEDSDAQGIGGWSGPGPYRIINNYIDGSGENILFGGEAPKINGTIPSDIEIRNNYLFKPLTWKANHPSYANVDWSIKNLFELKNGRRVVVDGNILENCWKDGQTGFAILFTPRTQGVAPWSGVMDVTFTRNIVRNASSGIQFLTSDEGRPSAGLHRITVQNNLFYNINPTEFGGDGRMIQIIQGGQVGSDWIIDHNTMLHEGSANAFMVLGGGGTLADRVQVTNNLVTHGNYGVKGSGAGTDALNEYFTNWSFLNNTLIAGGRASNYPATTMFAPDIPSVRFTDANADDYRLRTDSPYINAATDNGAVGANVAEIMALTCGVKEGVPSSTCSNVVIPPGTRPSITMQPASRSVAAGQTATFSITASGSAPLNYQWQSRATATSTFANIVGATSTSYTTPAATTTDNGKQFRCVVTNAVGTASSNAATLTVTATTVGPSITAQPSSRSVAPGASATFSVTATGTAPLGYQWKRANPGSSTFTNITGATSASYTVTNVTTAMSGTRYQVVVSNSISSVTSNSATLTVTSSGSAPTITVQPINTTVHVGNNATFTVLASGTSPITYQWQSRSSASGTFANIAGATSRSFTLFGATLSENNSQYRCLVTNPIGTTTSASAILTVNAPGTGSPTIFLLVPINNSTIASDVITAAFYTQGDLSNVDQIVLQLDDEDPVLGPSLSGTYDFVDVGIGQHTLVAYLAEADGTRIPGTTKTVTFTTRETGFEGGLPPPELNLPAYIPINGRVSLNYDPNYTNIRFVWAFEPLTGTTEASAPRAQVLGPASYASFETMSNVAALSGHNLQPGRYRITVQAFNSTGAQSVAVHQDVTLVTADFSSLRAFPNPWRSDRHTVSQIIFDGLPLSSTVKIFTVSGHIVRTLHPATTSTVWDLRNDEGDKVASGIYLYLVTVADSKEKTRGQLAIIR
jgi:hypothetical protein